MVTVGNAARRAVRSPPASALLEITTTISAGKSCGLGGLDQRRHVRSAPGNQDGDAAFHGLTMRQIEMAVIDHAVLAVGRDDFAQQRDGLAGFGEDVGDLRRRRPASRSRSCRCRS